MLPLPPEPSNVDDEEVLDVDEIQGNILAGFNKDHQVFLFLSMRRDATGIEAVRAWLRAITPSISTVAEVARFNDLFRDMRKRLGRDPHGLTATWMNIAFTADALRALTSAEEVDQFDDISFRDGMALVSAQLNDPTDPDAEGNPRKWVVGGTTTPCDIVLIIASDSEAVLAERVAEIKATMSTSADAQSGVTVGSALSVVWEQEGATLPPPLVGHEHFGFKDGISQPGVRGLRRRTPQRYLTPRLIDGSRFPQADVKLPFFSRPGQPLVWPGQFVFGYRRQSRKDARQPDDVMDAGPKWGKNGSFLVVRRLRQDVPAFFEAMRSTASGLAAKPPFTGLTPERLAALCVGRWPSGAPVMRSSRNDDPALGRDLYASNYFGYVNDAVPPPPLTEEAHARADTYPLSKGDSAGATCPLEAHVRKVNPRDTVTEQGSSQDVLARMILRRGIPFGARYPTTIDNPADAMPHSERDLKSERGLMFLCYQTSIDNQFVFLQQNWANNPLNPSDGGGVDPIIGQSDAADRSRSIDITGNDGTVETVALLREWVIPTGGGFFFSPSISTLHGIFGMPKHEL